MMTNKTVVIGNDHTGVSIKRELVLLFAEAGYNVIDCGTDTVASVDYPDVAARIAAAVKQNHCPGVAICGTGIGMSLALNKYPGIRCALCHDEFTARLAREHNDANILAMGARVLGSDLMKSMAHIFFNTGFSAGRHQNRLDKIALIESERY